MYSSVHLCKDIEEVRSGSNLNGPEVKHDRQYAHVLQNVGAEGRVDFLPAAQVSCSFVKQVTISRRQQVPHEYDGGAD